MKEFGLKKIRVLGFLAGLIFCFASVSLADTKTWNAAGGSGDWNDADNWYPNAAPGTQDDAVINSNAAAVTASSTFQAKSVTIGGHTVSTVQTNEFVSGTVEPAQTSDTAILNRRDGHLVLKGRAGTVHVKGSYKDSEESLAPRPSMVFYVK